MRASASGEAAVMSALLPAPYNCNTLVTQKSVSQGSDTTCAASIHSQEVTEQLYLCLPCPAHQLLWPQLKTVLPCSGDEICALTPPVGTNGSIPSTLASLILVDRQLDVLTPALHQAHVLDRIFGQLPARGSNTSMGHGNKEGVLKESTASSQHIKHQLPVDQIDSIKTGSMEADPAVPTAAARAGHADSVSSRACDTATAGQQVTAASDKEHDIGLGVDADIAAGTEAAAAAVDEGWADINTDKAAGTEADTAAVEEGWADTDTDIKSEASAHQTGAGTVKNHQQDLQQAPQQQQQHAPKQPCGLRYHCMAFPSVPCLQKATKIVQSVSAVSMHMCRPATAILEQAISLRQAMPLHTSILHDQIHHVGCGHDVALPPQANAVLSQHNVNPC